MDMVIVSLGVLLGYWGWDQIGAGIGLLIGCSIVIAGEFLGWWE